MNKGTSNNQDNKPVKYAVKFLNKNSDGLELYAFNRDVEPLKLKPWSKYVYTIIILVEYLNSAFIGSIFATAMVDMKYLFRTSMTSIAYVNTFISLGYVLGSMLGFLYVYLNRQITSIIMTLIMGIFLTIMPICPSLWILYGSAFLANMGSGGFDSGSYIWVIDMWKHHYSPVLHMTQMMFGLGNILGPLLMRSFIVGDVTKNPEYSEYLTQFTNSTTNDEINYSIQRKTSLFIPWSIAGSITTAVPFALIIMYFISKYKPANDNTDLDCNENVAKTNFQQKSRTRTTLIILIALSINSSNGLGLAHVYYSSTYYQYLSIGITASKAAEVLSVMSATFTVGRLFAVFIAIKLKPELMIGYHLVILSISMVFSYLGQNSITFIWIANALIGLGCSGQWSSYYSLTENYVKLTDKITSILLFSSQIFIILTPFLIGPLIEEQPQALLYLEFTCLLLTIILFIIILYIVRRLKKIVNM